MPAAPACLKFLWLCLFTASPPPRAVEPAPEATPPADAPAPPQADPVVEAYDWAAERLRVVVLANAANPVSVRLARLYMAQREIPESALCLLDLPGHSAITREQFDRLLAAPIRTWLESSGLWRMDGPVVAHADVRYLVIIHGVPLRILASNPARALASDTDAASIDSELACLPMGPHPLPGTLANPFFRSQTPLQTWQNAHQLIVARLDGPDAATVERMIRAPIAVETGPALPPVACFDLLDSPVPAHRDIDRRLQRVAHRLTKAGWNVQIERTSRAWPPDQPMIPPSIYAGWYSANPSSPFTSRRFRLPEGAIAVQMHESAAASLAQADAGWAATLLARGAAVTAGTVQDTPLPDRLDVPRFLTHLLDGWNVGQASAAATPSLSTQNVLLGDPLYRPLPAGIPGDR